MSKTRTKKAKTNTKSNKTAYIIISAVEFLLFIFGILDASDTINLFPFKGMLFFLFVASLPILLMYFLGKKFIDRGVFKFMGVVLIVAALFEITLFQYPTYSSFMSKSEQFTLTPAAATMSGQGFAQNADGSVTISGDEEAAMEFNNINRVIDTIKTDLEFSDSTKVLLSMLTQATKPTIVKGLISAKKRLQETRAHSTYK